MGHKDTYEEISAAVGRGDLDEVRGYIADGFVLREPEALPYGGEFVGPEGFVDLTRAIRSSFSVEVVSCVYTEAGDDLLVIEYVFDFTSLRTGDVVRAACVDLFRFDSDGKLLRGDIYYKDPAALAAVA